MIVRFEVIQDPTNPATPDVAQYGGFMVYAKAPSAGNDSALLAVFDSREAAEALAEVLNFAAGSLAEYKRFMEMSNMGDQKTDDDQGSDNPNGCGPVAKPVKDPRAGRMTPSDEYDHRD